MGDFLSSVLPPGLIDVLSALIPPVVVGAVFCTFIIQLLRKEMAPRRMDGSLVSKDEAAKVGDGAEGAAGSGGAGAADAAPIAQSGERAESDGR
ncbi:hypothetical protein [Nocardiopsis halotolerans]|uniref:hypothetical protein n=1 Tax=Nocardiopsis halotolerans TaxID=124252 RepID=UPI000369DF65|nr:hypothetical protein [Nocardiopsis halotolerans]